MRAIKRRHLTNHDLYKVNMRGLTGQALDNVEPMVLQAAVDEYWNPKNVPLGEIHERKRLDGMGRVVSIDWLGQESFVKQMMPCLLFPHPRWPGQNQRPASAVVADGQLHARPVAPAPLPPS